MLVLLVVVHSDVGAGTYIWKSVENQSKVRESEDVSRLEVQPVATSTGSYPLFSGLYFVFCLLNSQVWLKVIT